MQERERQRDTEHRGPEAGMPGGDPQRLAATRERAERITSAADEAINRALSRDSEAFVRASRQHGGE